MKTLQRLDLGDSPGHPFRGNQWSESWQTDEEEGALVDRAANLIRTSLRTPSLSRDQEDSIDTYAGSAYDDINESLRGTRDVPDQMLGGQAMSTHIENLTDVIEQSVTTRPLTTFRTMTDEPDPAAPHVTDTFSRLRPGDTFVDRGFVSTSLSRPLTEMFLNDEAAVHVEIRLPTGSHAVPGNPFEAELILQRDTRFRVETVERDEVGDLKVRVTSLGAKPRR